MISRPRLVAATLAGLTALGLAGAVVAAPADAASSAAPAPVSGAAGGSPSAVTVFLKAPHPAALARLAATPFTDQALRNRQLAALVPSDAARASVGRVLSSQGFTITHRTSWSISASAPASTVAELFGRRPAAAVHSVATGPLPEMPESLRSLVSAVYPTTGGPAAYRPSAATTILAGGDFRNADSGATKTPSTGKKDAGVTVATLQLADFNSSDLTNYAKMSHLKDPVAGKTYRGVPVDGGPSAMDDAGEGSIEVDLDQESILSTAPSAHQAAYFAPNTQSGFNDVFANVYDDKVGNAMATSPDPNLVALSSSWGECEGETGAANINTLEPILESVVASGVTIFASSGDDGIYDCRSTSGTGDDNSQADVDFPASSPYVVSSGGSNLSAADGSAPNTGGNWVEKTWSCTDASSCQNTNTGTGGGGGGASGSAVGHDYAGTTADFKGFAMPAYQKRTLTGPYAAATTRLVPDIAADGDPQTGFKVYFTPGLPGGGTGTFPIPVPIPPIPGGANTLQVGGTSLASPISAAQLANTLGDAGHAGVGDIHPALYSAMVKGADLAPTDAEQALRDVTVGQIGADGDKGSDPSVKAAKGFDTTSGVGGVLWNSLGRYLFSTGAPRASASVAVGQVVATSSTTPLTFHWTSSEGDDPIVLNTTAVSITEQGSSSPVFTSAEASGSTTVDGVAGKIYTIKVTAKDLAGHATTSRADNEIAPAPRPVVTGRRNVGKVLLGHVGRWDPKATLVYRWLRDGHIIPGARTTAYRPVAADRTHHLSFAVVGREAGFPTTVRISSATGPIDYGTQTRRPRPTIEGLARHGHRLFAHPGRHDAGTRISYRWYSGRHLTTDHQRVYRVTGADHGRRIRLRVTSTRPGYHAVTRSRSTSKVR